MITEKWEAGMVLNYGVSPMRERKHLHQSDTFEKAWLREVMASKHGKFWNGKDWEEIE